MTSYEAQWRLKSPASRYKPEMCLPYGRIIARQADPDSAQDVSSTYPNKTTKISLRFEILSWRSKKKCHFASAQDWLFHSNKKINAIYSIEIILFDINPRTSRTYNPGRLSREINVAPRSQCLIPRMWWGIKCISQIVIATQSNNALDGEALPIYQLFGNVAQIHFW